MIRCIIFSIWLTLVILWNYEFPHATPFDNVFVTVCLVLFLKLIEGRYDK